MIINIGCIAASFGVLMPLDGKPRTQWTASIEPNTVVSALATVAKAASLFIIAACLGQYNWMHMQRTHPLSHMQVLDDGSRGSPFAAVRMIWETRTWYGSLAGALIIASLVLEPTAQQAIGMATGRTILFAPNNTTTASNTTLTEQQSALGISKDYRSASCQDPRKFFAFAFVLEQTFADMNCSWRSSNLILHNRGSESHLQWTARGVSNAISRRLSSLRVGRDQDISCLWWLHRRQH